LSSTGQAREAWNLSCKLANSRVHLPKKSLNYEINLRSALLFIAMLQALITAGLLLTRGIRRQQSAYYFLAALLFYLACSLIEHFIGFMGVYDYAREQGHDLTFFPFSNAFMYGPLLLLYTRALTDAQFVWRQRYVGHFALPALYYMMRLSVWLMPDAEKFHFLDETLPGTLAQYGADLLCYVVTGWYVWMAIRRYQRYRNLIEQEYSNIDRLTLDWLRIFLFAFATYLVFDFCYNVAGLFLELWYTGWYWLNLIRAMMLYYLSATGWAFAQKSTVEYNALAVRTAASTAPLSTVETPQPTKQALSPEELGKRREQLLQYMDQTQPWLDPEITLSELAQSLGLNVTQMSYLVNAGTGQNFNDFINQYRVDAVKKKMADPSLQHLSLLGIAFECGFNSKATFNRAFKKLTGTAPSTFLSQRTES
jgi:AraC-like DNA-binding protein